MSDELPKGWTSVELEEHVYIAGRIGWRGLKRAEYTKSGPRFLAVKNILPNGQIDFTETDHLSRERYDESPEIQLKRNDVLLTKDGTIGKVGMVDSLPGPTTVNSSILVVRPNNELLLDRYLFHFLRGPKFQEIARERITGSAIPHLFQKDIKKLRALVPPANEQRRIVAKLETVLDKVDASQQRLAKIPVLLKRFRQSVLAAACSGRLTADWREENDPEDAATLIERIRAKHPARYQDAAVRDDLELPAIPDTWSWTNLRFLLSPTEAFCYGVVQPGADDPEGAFLVRAGDLNAGRVDISSLRRIPMAIHTDYRRSQLLGGEILVTVVGAGIGETAIAQPECAGFNIARAVAKLPVREFNARCVHLWLQTGRAIAWMKGDSREVARPTLNLEQLQTLPAPVAPLPEQQEIVRRVEGLFALADQLEVRLAKARGQVDALTPSLLARAFSGQLVPQDPTDEAAEKLLERIKQARMSSPTTPSKGRQ